MLNLVYHQTQDEEVYQVLSKRLKDKYDIFGGLPDTIEDEWIDNIEKLDAMMNQYMHLRQQAKQTLLSCATRKQSIQIETDGNYVRVCWLGRTWWKSCPNHGDFS